MKTIKELIYIPALEQGFHLMFGVSKARFDTLIERMTEAEHSFSGRLPGLLNQNKEISSLDPLRMLMAAIDQWQPAEPEEMTLALFMLGGAFNKWQVRLHDLSRQLEAVQQLTDPAQIKAMTDQLAIILKEREQAQNN